MRKYLFSLDHLRGFAAISVCLFHFTDKLNYLSPANLFKQTFQFGHYGVELFFIISGFVIPYSMANGNYAFRKFSTFIRKRFIRIEPPYLICVFICLVLNFITTLSPFYSGKAFQLDYTQIVYHLGYFNGLLGKEWLNPVFWTLAVEFQYYLLIALIFPLISHRNSYVWFATLLLFNILSFYTDRNYVFNFSILFTVGILLFRFYFFKLNKFEVVFLSVLTFGFLYSNYSYKEIIVVILSVALIVMPLKPSFFSRFFGNISYSLYLLHFPIGLRIINLTQRFSDSETVRVLMILAAFAFTIIISYFYYKFIEKPFKSISHNIKYNSEKYPGSKVANTDKAYS